MSLYASPDHLERFWLCRPELLHVAMVQPNVGQRLSSLGLSDMGDRSILVPDL